MIILITGTPGSGKTLLAVSKIKEALSKGRPVFTNIDGISLDGVQPAPDDWRDTPDGSLICFDEIQQKWPATGKTGGAPADDIKALEIHRHTGHDIIVITQHPTLVHHHVRKLVGEHTHVRRVSGANRVTLFTGSECFDHKDKNELRNLDKTTWKYPKELFQVYKSATAHTHKFKLPAKFKALFIVLGIIFSILFYLIVFQNSVFAFMSSDEEHTAETKAQRQSEAPGPFLRSLSSYSDIDVSGCMVIDDRCRCWDSESSPLVLDNQACLIVSRDFIKR